MTLEDNLKNHNHMEAFKGVFQLKCSRSYLSCLKRFALYLIGKL